jgi:hypothetical protein
VPVVSIAPPSPPMVPRLTALVGLLSATALPGVEVQRLPKHPVDVQVQRPCDPTAALAAACACRGAWAIGSARSALDGGASCVAAAGKTDTHIARPTPPAATASRRGLEIVGI